MPTTIESTVATVPDKAQRVPDGEDGVRLLGLEIRQAPENGRVVSDAGEPDHRPGRNRGDGGDGDRNEGFAHSTRRGEPGHERPDEELEHDAQPNGARGDSRTTVSVRPGQRREQYRGGDRSSLP